jgi:hypothetical protein
MNDTSKNQSDVEIMIVTNHCVYRHKTPVRRLVTEVETVSDRDTAKTARRLQATTCKLQAPCGVSFRPADSREVLAIYASVAAATQFSSAVLHL